MRARLETVRGRIEALVGRLDAARENRDAHTAALRDAERRAGALAVELDGLDRALAEARTRQTTLREREATVLADVEAQRAALARRIRSAFAMGRHDTLELLMNQESPARVQRVLAYHGYLARARTRRLEALRRAVTNLESVRSGAVAETRRLEHLRGERREASDALAVQVLARRAALDGLRAELSSGAEALERLRVDESELQRLVDGIGRELSDIPLSLDSGGSFPDARGTLAWPAAGALLRGYGTPRESGNLSWQGVLIGAEPGAPVRAVFRGRVAYAEWLRGFGLLVIIDHGDGYMSLYGHNAALFAEVGDWVEAGDTVARVGDSGGHESTGVYFEIRHRGRPSDPARWCRGSPSTALVTPKSAPLFLAIHRATPRTVPRAISRPTSEANARGGPPGATN